MNYDEIKEIKIRFIHMLKENDIPFGEWEILSGIISLLDLVDGKPWQEKGNIDNCEVYGKAIAKLNQFYYSTEEKNYVVPRTHYGNSYSYLPWENPEKSDSYDNQVLMRRSQDEANSDRRFMESFSRPGVGRYL